MPTGKKIKAERDYRDFMKCELCEFGYLENYEENESISVEEYENLTTEGRCTGCIEEYGTDGYPDR